jgi:hypothetical protein
MNFKTLVAIYQCTQSYTPEDSTLLVLILARSVSITMNLHVKPLNENGGLKILIC